MTQTVSRWGTQVPSLILNFVEEMCCWNKHFCYGYRNPYITIDMIIEIIFSKVNDEDITPMNSKRRGKDRSEAKVFYHKICKDSGILTSVMKLWEGKLLWPSINISNKHQREKLLSVIATECSWIAASFMAMQASIIWM